MFELVILNLINNQKFSKFFNSKFLKEDFKKKCKYSNNIRIIAELRN